MTNIHAAAFEAIMDTADELAETFHASEPEAYLHLLQAALTHVAIGVMSTPRACCEQHSREQCLAIFSDIITTMVRVALNNAEPEELH